MKGSRSLFFTVHCCLWGSSTVLAGFVESSVTGTFQLSRRGISVGGNRIRTFSMSYRGGQGRGGRGRGRGGGRGEYYKNKYGRGGRDRDTPRTSPSGGGTFEDLQNLLRCLDGKSYPSYHDLDTDLSPSSSGWVHSQKGFTLFCERAQSDPFAPPTRCKVVVSASKAGFPIQAYSNNIRSIALADFLLRGLYKTCKDLGADSSMAGNGGWKGPKGGDIQVLEPCQHVLEQSAVYIDSTGNVIAQITVNLPARGRTILGHAAESIFTQTIPTLVERCLYYSSLPKEKLRKHVEMVEDQIWLQKQLKAKNLVAFVRNGAILPRKSGADDRPMNPQGAPDAVVVAFQSPKRLEAIFTLPNAKETIHGMGIPKGISLVCGGGFHGKSTLLETLQLGIYPKIPGDGREFCMTSPSAVKIRAEDGRHIQAVDISNFIRNLPFGKDTTCFSSEDASGSTSQATNIVEALECGSTALLMDEDTCATNFMIRDDKMMQLVAPEKEPITPFVRTVRSLYDDFGVSSILVIGGTGDYFDVADNVLVMDSYKCLDATEQAKAIAANASSNQSSAQRASESLAFLPVCGTRTIYGNVFAPNGKVKTNSVSSISYGETELDLKCVEQLVSKAQTVAISSALQRLSAVSQREQSFKDTLIALENLIDKEGLHALTPGQCHGGMARPRIHEIAAAINRLRREGSIGKK